MVFGRRQATVISGWNNNTRSILLFRYLGLKGVEVGVSYFYTFTVRNKPIADPGGGIEL